MRGVLCFCLSLISVSVFAAEPRLATKQELAAARRQKKRCDDGVAFACYDYGVTLSLSKSKKKKQEGERLIRRACTLAYAPACQRRRDVSSNAKPAADPSKPTAASGCVDDKTVTSAELTDAGGGQQIGKVEKGSALDRAGFLPGDVIKTVNGESISSHERLMEALDDTDGTADIVVERSGASVPLNFTCDTPAPANPPK